MINEQVSEWLKKYRGKIRPEMLASAAEISMSTLQLGLRGARWSAATIDKLQTAMATLAAQHDQDTTGTKPAA